MGLLGNGFRHNLTGRITTATTAIDGCNASCVPASYNLTAMRRNMLIGSGISNPQASVPQGVRPPVAWLMAREGGGISSYRRTDISVSGAVSAEMGFPRTGTTTVSIDGAAVGGLIVGASGAATISVDGAADVLGVITGDGSTTISIDGSAALGAIASLVGEATVSISGSAEIMGLGYMTGTTIESGMTPDGIARAVWSAPAATNNDPGTMGEKLNDAGSAANPWTEVIESGYTAAEILRLIAAVAQGSATDLEGAAPVFKSIDGTKNRVTATYAGGTRTVTGRDAT